MRRLKYSIVVDSYEKLEGHTGRLAIREVLAELLRQTPKDELPMLVYLTQGKLRPDYEGVELGIAEKLALRALHTASGKPVEMVRETYIRAGDIGTAAEKLLEESRQEALFSEQLTLKRVYDTLFDIAKTSGEGSVEAKLKELGEPAERRQRQGGEVHPQDGHGRPAGWESPTIRYSTPAQSPFSARRGTGSRSRGPTTSPPTSVTWCSSPPRRG